MLTDYNLNEFITKATEEIKYCEEKQLIQDIILIFNNRYKNYSEYVDCMKTSNKRIDEIEQRMYFHSFTFSYHPKHTILDKRMFDFIIEVSKLYVKEGDDKC